MSLTGSRALVTGAGGFIGSHLVERLVELGVETRALVHYRSDGGWGWLDRSPIKASVEVVAGDIRDRESLEAAFADVGTVFHLAALIGIPYSYKTARSYVRTNVEGTLNVLELARAHGVERIVHTSTSEVYGTAQVVPIREDHPLSAQSPYAASKTGADQMALSFHRSFGLPISIVRPFNTYGPRQSARAVIPTIISQALNGATSVRLGSLTPTRDFNYVADTVEGFVCAAQRDEAIGEVFNLGSGREISIGDLAKAILGVVGQDLPIVSEDARIRPEGSEVDRLCADGGKAASLLGWTPKHTLEQGLAETVAWIRANLDEYRADAYAV